MEDLHIKNEFGAGILELSRLASTERVTSNRMVSAKPCWILSATVEANNADNKSQVKLINGETSASEIVLNLKGRYAHPTHGNSLPFYFNRGVYVELTDNADAVTIQYLQDSP